jgi:hypothetical protein
MRIARTLGTIAALTAAAVGTATPAFATTPKTPQTVAGVQARVNAKAEHITAKMQTLQSRLTTRPALNAARNTLQADITKVLADTVTWRRQIDAATTMAGIRSADPAHQTVKTDLAKLHTDLAAAKAKKNTVH